MGSGNDILVGGAGDDIRIGGEGRDLLVGGIGGDTPTAEAAENSLIGSTAADAYLDAAFAALAREQG
jgi:Ca2+-binding RTX toxin-like protein